ncbi:MAG TPA: UDP-N-acetylmuramoyl-L-alanyl-D-glutamate--2,6-diaminopimelate ligase [Actinomycetota bacterium]|nr:UDP-N-acetylmuramoyl-L-alanyl-D-glutamate--2,6-diaminopimelate ligase [Actinomycetota bacterium]
MSRPAPARAVGDLARAAGDLFVRLRGDPATPVSGVAFDSRAVRPGDLFFCVPGGTADGHRFAPHALAAGAAALCVERPVDGDAPQVVVADVRRAMARVGAEFYGRPAEQMAMLGVTGTNGKTTTAFLLESMLRTSGRTTGLVGTIETRVAGATRRGVRTTPESLDLQALFAEMVAAGVDAVAMEVTSHALALHRVEGIRFRAAAFTNLSQDHLDFHGDMSSYFEAKRSLFRPGRVETGAANVDDPYGRKLAETAEVPFVAFGTSPDADVRATDVTLRPSGSEFVLSTRRGDVDVTTTLAGAFNVSNCLAAAAVASSAGLGLADVAAGIAALDAVPGRFERVDAGQPFAVVVDYAHTPGSLESALHAARELAGRDGGRVVCVFGCGGGRDRGKRPLMGAAAARAADIVVVTSDNPRHEPPEAIAGEVVEGIVATRAEGPDAVVLDRSEAISVALRRARPGDVVLVAGKGHETGQEIGDVVVPFDDRDAARAALAELGWGRDE